MDELKLKIPTHKITMYLGFVFLFLGIALYFDPNFVIPALTISLIGVFLLAATIALASGERESS